MKTKVRDINEQQHHPTGQPNQPHQQTTPVKPDSKDYIEFEEVKEKSN